MTVLVTGAGGFLGHHLTRFLVARGYRVRGADAQPPAFAPTAAHEFMALDLRRPDDAAAALEGVDEVYHLAANMGGMGFIAFNKAAIAHDNVLMDANVLEAARRAGAARLFYASSACVYPPAMLEGEDGPPLREEDAYPADPVDGYGWEKLYGERLCRHYREDYGLETRIARFHSMYGPLGTYDGGREKAPAAICRKVALAPDEGDVTIWGDGRQTRTYCHVTDGVDGIYRLMRSDVADPINIGSDRLVTIDALTRLIIAASGKRLGIVHDASGPEGVRGRGCDLTRARTLLGWEPRVSLAVGMRETYEWIAGDLARRGITADGPADVMPAAGSRPPAAGARGASGDAPSLTL